jgi:hypothetical protein
MPLRQKTDGELAGELEAIATAAAERRRAWADGDEHGAAQLQERVGEAASRAIGAGVSLGAIADAERIGQARAREELGREVLQGVGRAARRSARLSTSTSKRSRAARVLASHIETWRRRHT